MTRAYSIRAQIVAIVMAGAILPLALVGFWLASSSVRSGTDLLRQHLNAAAERFTAVSETRWQYRNADLQLLAHNDVTQRALAGAPLSPADTQYLATLVAEMSGWVSRIELRDGADRVRWVSRNEGAGAARGAGGVSPNTLIELQVPATSGGVAGNVIVQARLAAFIPADSGLPLVAGSRVAVRQFTSRRLIAPLDAGLAFPEEDAVTIGGKPWLVARRTVAGPDLEVAFATPLASYVAPFESAGRIGLAALAMVALIAFGLTTYLATRLTHPVRQLADAADAVAQGNLDRRVNADGPKELRRLGSSFNVMTESLDRTLRELSQKRALAAIGEFATSLSHDVRNALTSIKVDLQRAARRPSDDHDGRALVERALNNVARLESSVSGALLVARGGTAAQAVIDLRDVLGKAADMVQGAYSAVPAVLEVDLGNAPQRVSGDSAALEQLFANLLFNAGQALRAGGRVQLRSEIVDGKVVVSVSDNGVGMPASGAPQSTKSNGTGFGLPIARRIAAAHGGDLRIASVPGEGTTVRVELPRD